MIFHHLMVPSFSVALFVLMLLFVFLGFGFSVFLQFLEQIKERLSAIDLKNK